MAKKEKPELVNPKWLVRKIYVLPGLDIELREMILALWAHSNTFIEASEARRGSVSFTCQASQTQLAAFCHLKTEKSAYSRLVRLNKLGLVEWTTNRSHKANEYYVQLDLTSVVMTTGDTDENPFDALPLAGEPPVSLSSVVEEASSVVSSLSSVVEASSSVVQTTDSGFSGSYDLADTGLRLTETGTERFAETRGASLLDHTRETLDPKTQTPNLSDIASRLENLIHPASRDRLLSRLEDHLENMNDSGYDLLRALDWFATLRDTGTVTVYFPTWRDSKQGYSLSSFIGYLPKLLAKYNETQGGSGAWQIEED